jgi:transposase
MTTSTISLETLQKENAKLHEEISYLKEQIAWFQRQIFGQKSEKFVDTRNAQQLHLDGFDNLSSQETPIKQKVAAHDRVKVKRGGQDKISLPENLPVERQVLDLPEEEKKCSETGEALVKIGEEVTRKLACTPARFFIIEIVRPKYALPQKSELGIQIAQLPESLLTRCQADESLLAEILVKKFADHLPLYRQSEMLARENIGISRQTLSNWVVRCGLALKPLYEEMTRHILQSGNVFIDESPIDMLDPGKGKVHQSYMWVLVGGQAADPPYRIYNFRTDRCHHNVFELLKGYSGVLHSDKYGAYETMANTKQFVWSPCWAHIRRKFEEAESGDPVFRQWVLRQIRYLFMFERIAWSRSEEERLRIRQEKEAPIIDRLIKAVKDKLTNGKVLPKSKFKEALGYFCSLIPHLKNYTLHPYARLDNNVAERAVRPLTLGRKNWLFVGNEVGGEAAAIILSLVQTCRGLDINPREYLEDIMRRLMSHNAQKLHELLPDQWAKARQK